MRQMGDFDAVDLKTMDKLSKKMQRCLAVVHKIPGIDDSKEVAQLTTLLSPLSISHEPLTPRQALNLGQVDYYGRAVLLASLLQGLNHQVYVVLGNHESFFLFDIESSEKIEFQITYKREMSDNKN